ncbi:hypothetical protein TrLO_g5757 [Triparma laevis f. longispina]|uniref:Uncharacterized protein n=1 Tax=Triparma laevis f. longispina TaxID=1714387 RepID=A0A9W7FH60_9STRA|nr:hypothetical protein TrLO_g5757 [Triparma laevis f. longispina]
MPTSVKMLPTLSRHRSTAPDGRVIVHDAVEMLAYTRQIDNLNIFLNLVGKIPLNSRLHSRVAICSIYQNVSPQITDAYMSPPNSDSYSTSFSSQIGSVGVHHPNLLTSLNQTNQSESEEDLEGEGALEIQLPGFWSQLAEELSDLVNLLKRTDASREILPPILHLNQTEFDSDRENTIKDEWEHNDSKSKPVEPKNNGEPVDIGEMEEAFEMLVNICISQECISILRIKEKGDVKTAKMYVEKVFSRKFVGGDEKRDIMRNLLMRVFKKKFQKSTKPEDFKKAKKVFDEKEICELFGMPDIELSSFQTNFLEFLEMVEKEILGVPKMIETGLYYADMKDDEGWVVEEAAEKVAEEVAEEEKSSEVANLNADLDETMLEDEDEEDQDKTEDEALPDVVMEMALVEAMAPQAEMESKSSSKRKTTKKEEKKQGEEVEEEEEEEEEIIKVDEASASSDEEENGVFTQAPEQLNLDEDEDDGFDEDEEGSEELVTAPAPKPLPKKTPSIPKPPPSSGRKSLNAKPKKGEKLAFSDSDCSDEDTSDEEVTKTKKRPANKENSKAIPNRNINTKNLAPYRTSNKRPKKRMWTEEEAECVRAGVARYGEGRWADILHEYSDVLVGRTSVNVKDKWRNMNK